MQFIHLLSDKIMKILLFLSILLFCACNDGHEEPITGSFFEKSFIQRYLVVEKISLDIVDSDGDMLKLALLSEGKHFEKKSQTFEELSEKYNDLSYNNNLVPYTNNAIANRFVSMSMYSDADFDEKHPAGTLLNDIVSFYGESIYPYIKNNYEGEWYSQTNKKLNELSEEDLVLLRFRGDNPVNMGILSFDKKPTKAKKHTFTLTIIDNEEALDTSVTFEFK